MRALRAGLIGAGAFGRKHLEAMKAIPGLEMRAVADVNREAAERAAREYGAKHVYQDYRQMLAREKLDFVDVCTPEPLHREPVVEAAEHGVNVLVEKPIATTTEDADAMIRAAEKNRISMMVGHILRWDPRYASVKEMIDRDELGRIASIYARRTTPRSIASTYLTRVGVLPVLGIHDIDLILWYTGRKVRECSSYATRLLRYANPDSVVCALAFRCPA